MQAAAKRSGRTTLTMVDKPGNVPYMPRSSEFVGDDETIERPRLEDDLRSVMRGIENLNPRDC